MARTPTSSVTGEEFIDELLEKNKELEKENKKLKKELEKLKSTYVYDAKQVRDIC